MTEVKLAKKDWEELKKAAEMNMKQSLISVEQFTALLDLSEKRLAEFPTDDEESKEILDALTGDVDDSQT